MQELRTDRFRLKDIFPDKAKSYAQKLKRKAGELEFVRKGISIDPKDIEIKEGERAAIRLVTTPHLDRDGEILIPGGGEYSLPMSVLWAHDYKGLPIGSDRWIKTTREGILAKTYYANHQFAEDVYQCVKDKHLNSNSVGFIPVEAVTPEDKKQFAQTQEILEKDYGILKDESAKAKNIYTKWIMLEHSDVPIASNAQSLNLAVSKGELIIQSERLKKDLEIELIQDEKEDREIELEAEPSATEGVITKPEETENYIRIPAPGEAGKHDGEGHRIRTITISESDGIKALYCGTCKKVITYLFDVKKWTMEEAKKWVQEHKEFENIEIKEPGYKERWNKSLSRIFDIERAESTVPIRFLFALYEKFLGCKVKEIFVNSYSIPSPLLGTYLAGFKKILNGFRLKDTRNFSWDGSEVPPLHEVIKLNSEKSDDFLIDGIRFYDANGKPFIAKFSSGWYGIDVSIITSDKNKEWNKELLDEVHDWVQKNNYLKGEKFALSGEFLSEPGDNWDNLILDTKYKDSIIKSANFLEKKGKELTGRGLLFIGPPGTGKTKTGRVLMNELDSTFIWVSSRDFRHIGPMKALSLGFSLARDLAPSILFLEDIDTWLRGEMEFVTDLVKTEMDGLKQNKGLITIMTSNNPEKLPNALLDRPGRFHHIINFELPKEKERTEMLELWAGEIKSELLEDIVEKTEGFSGAHLKELVEFAKMIAEEDGIAIGEALLKSLDKLIEQRELIEEIRNNKTDAKEFWAKTKWIDGEIEIKKDKEIRIELADDIETKIDDSEEKTEKEIIDGEVIHWANKTAEIRILDIPEFENIIQDFRDQLIELKEGRILSTKNRTLVKDTIEALSTLKDKLEELYNATEPSAREEERGLIEREVIIEKDGKQDNFDERIAGAIERLLENDRLSKMMNDAIKEALDVSIKKKLGKVE